MNRNQQSCHVYHKFIISIKRICYLLWCLTSKIEWSQYFNYHLSDSNRTSPYYRERKIRTTMSVKSIKSRNIRLAPNLMKTAQSYQVNLGKSFNHGFHSISEATLTGRRHPRSSLVSIWTPSLNPLAVSCAWSWLVFAGCACVRGPTYNDIYRWQLWVSLTVQCPARPDRRDLIFFVTNGMQPYRGSELCICYVATPWYILHQSQCLE